MYGLDPGLISVTVIIFRVFNKITVIFVGSYRSVYGKESRSVYKTMRAINFRYENRLCLN